MYDGAPSKKEGSQTQSDAGIINSGTEKCVRPVFVFFFFFVVVFLSPPARSGGALIAGDRRKKLKPSAISY